MAGDFSLLAIVLKPFLVARRYENFAGNVGSQRRISAASKSDFSIWRHGEVYSNFDFEFEFKSQYRCRYSTQEFGCCHANLKSVNIVPSWGLFLVKVSKCLKIQDSDNQPYSSLSEGSNLTRQYSLRNSREDRPAVITREDDPHIDEPPPVMERTTSLTPVLPRRVSQPLGKILNFMINRPAGSVIYLSQWRFFPFVPKSKCWTG